MPEIFDLTFEKDEKVIESHLYLKPFNFLKIKKILKIIENLDQYSTYIFKTLLFITQTT